MAGVSEAPVAFSEDLDFEENPEESGDKVKRVRHTIICSRERHTWFT